jgi:DNA-binding MarR family transcriptional regulator
MDVLSFMMSPLGRSVARDDWRTFHEDTILKLLFDVANSPFNPADIPLVLQSLENTTGMDRATVASICRVLEQQGLIELHPNTSEIEAARLTQLGRARVWERLASQGSLAG